MYKKIIFIITLSIFAINIQAQTIIGGIDSTLVDFSSQKEYEIGGVTVTGGEHLDKGVLILLSGLAQGDVVQVPGDKFSTAIENLWKQGLFEDIKITATKIQGKFIFVNIDVLERPRLSKFTLRGMTKTEADDVREKIKLIKGKVVTDALIASNKSKIKEFFSNKGYLDIKVDVKIEKDEKLENGVILNIVVTKGSKIKIQDINLVGNKFLTSFKIRRTFKETKCKRWWNPFNQGKLDEDNYEKDKKMLISKYNSKGFRDAKIVKDSIYRVGPKRMNIDLTIDEGNRYYFRNINWIGNSKYSSKILNEVLGIKKGEVYDQAHLDSKLNMNPNGNDISSIYMDDGYLFFNVTPVEIMVTSDSIDLEMRIYEGKQAVINKVTVIGNTKTNDHVVIREIRTKPGQLFRRSDIIRSQRELSQLGYFDPEKMNVVPTPNAATGTVDIEYTVEEKPSDQIELSGGYGGGRIVGTLGVSFNNFSAKNFFKKNAWRPLPSGNGQRLSVRAQTNGIAFQSYNISFTEPWLGGKNPNSLSVTAYYSIQSNGYKKSDKFTDGSSMRQSLDIVGVSVGLGKRLKKPDDYFTLYQELNYQYYTLNNYSSIFSFSKGYSNNIYYKASLQRNSVDKPIFETRGSRISLTGQWTPPYSFFNNINYNSPTITDQQRFKFVEYQKYKFTATFFTPITNKRGPEGKEARNLILRTSIGLGFLTSYNNNVGQSPFERFYLGGSGLTGFALDGREIIALRGYDDQAVTPLGKNGKVGGSYITKYTAELRFPITLNPQATIYVLSFAEAGNNWATAKEFNPFDVYRSVGVGVRIFLPMFGLLGFDYGWRLDDTRFYGGALMQKSQFHFTIGASIGEL
jgi:outer membrane protein insertion porin family